jgi:hypothetical protein
MSLSLPALQSTPSKVLLTLGLVTSASWPTFGASHADVSSIAGRIDRATFPSAVDVVRIESVDGTVRAPVDAAGRFEASLSPGVEYRLLVGDGAAIPIVLRASSGRLDTTVFARTGRARIDLGTIRFVDGSKVRVLPLPRATSRMHCDPDPVLGSSAADIVDPADTNGEVSDALGSAPPEPTDQKPTDRSAIPERSAPEELDCGDGEEADG